MEPLSACAVCVAQCALRSVRCAVCGVQGAVCVLCGVQYAVFSNPTSRARDHPISLGMTEVVLTTVLY